MSPVPAPPPTPNQFMQGTSSAQAPNLSGSLSASDSEQINFGNDIGPGSFTSPVWNVEGGGRPIRGGASDAVIGQEATNYVNDAVTALTHGTMTVADAMAYMEKLPPDQFAAVQSELYNAGYYGHSASNQMSWGIPSTGDATAFHNFLLDAAAATNQGTSVDMMLAERTHSYAATQQTGTGKAPVNDLGKNYTVTHLDPNQARDMVDQAALKTLGRALPENERDAMAAWLDQNYTAKQMATYQGDIAQNRTNAVAQAQAADLVDPQTGKALDFNAVTQLARGQLGIPYQWGGNGPQAGSQGFDCSGLVQYVYKQLGINLPRTSQQQWAAGGGTKTTDLKQAQPGDLVFFSGSDGTTTSPGHVGIYIGNGMMIDAPTTGSYVRIDPVASFGGFVGVEHFDAATSQQTPQNAPSSANQTFEGNTPGTATGIGNPELARFMAAERQQESGGDYTSKNPSGASGAYQFEQPTWDEWAAKAGLPNWVGKNPASAPPAVQDQVAATAMNQYFTQTGSWADVASMWYSGKPLSQLSPAEAAASQNGGPSIQDYVNSVTSKMGSGNLITTQGGRDVVTTPNTFTNTTMEDTSTEQADLMAEIRARNPALAQTHDFASAYDMLSKSIKTGINPSNG